MSSEQVASVLRQSSMHGQCVKFIVARPVQSSLNNIELVGKDDDSIKKALREQLTLANNSLVQTDAILIRTQEIMDKNIDLPSRIKLESEKDAKVATPTIEIEPASLLVEAELPPPPALEEVKNPLEYSVELSRLEKGESAARTLVNLSDVEVLNAEMKKFGIQLRRDEEKGIFYLAEVTLKDTTIEFYDHLIELNDKPVSQRSEELLLEDKLNLKLCRASLEFKSQKIKEKWLEQVSLTFS